MSDPTDFDFAMSALWRGALPAKFDRHMAPAFAGPKSRRQTGTPRFILQEQDEQTQLVDGLKSDRDYYKAQTLALQIENERLVKLLMSRTKPGESFAGITELSK